jgi:aminoglycoside phosphotransferase (APT) family kinase protein
MQSASPELDQAVLVQRIRSEYAVNVSQLTFLPKGEEAYTYLARTTAGERYFVRVQDTARTPTLESIYQLTHALQQQTGLSPVVAPLATPGGRLAIRLGAFLVALFPYIEGASLWEQGAMPGDLAQAGKIVASLHERGAAVAPAHWPRETFANPFRLPIEAAIECAIQFSLEEDLHQRQVIERLVAAQSDIEETFARMEHLQTAVLRLPIDWVLTHGDPNLDNFLKDEQGKLHLTDWGELAWGPPERDVFAFIHLGEGFATFLRKYATRRPHVRLHVELFAFYSYRWAMQEIADYAPRILSGELYGQARDHAWTKLQEYLPIPHAAIDARLHQVQTALDSIPVS